MTGCKQGQHKTVPTRGKTHKTHTYKQEQEVSALATLMPHSLERSPESSLSSILWSLGSMADLGTLYRA